VTTAPALPYRADIDGLRAVAVLAVVAYHADARLAPGGFAGVDLFFVISGFLITSLLLQSLRTGSFRARDFYARRIRRLAPSLVVVLAAAAVAGWLWLLADELAQLATHIASSAAFVTNFVLWNESGYFDRAAETKPLLHLWSLGVEEQFYLAWPWLLWITWGRLRPLTTIAGVVVLSFAANVVMMQWSPTAAFYWPISRFWELGLGGMLACVSLEGHRPQRNVLSVAGLAALVAAFALLRGDVAFPGWWATLPTLGAAFLIAAGPDAWINRIVLTRRALVFVGLISYPLYLWHWPVLTFARILAGGPLPVWLTGGLVALTFALSWLSYRLLERPLRHAPSRWVVPGLVVATAAIGALALGVSLRGELLPRRFPAEVQAVVDFSYRYEPVYRERVCYLMPDQPPSALSPECVETSPAGQPLVVLWGDSHAAHLYPGLQSLQRRTPFRLAEFTGSRCPPLLDLETPTQPYCQDVNRHVLDELPKLKPQTVVMAARWRLYDHDLDKLRRTVDEVRRATDARVVVVGPVPHWNARLPRVLFAYFRQHPRQPLPSRMLFGLEGYVWDFDREVREQVERTGVEYLSAMDALCTPRDGCLTKVPEGTEGLTAWDEAHLTASGSIHLIAQLAPRILPAAR